MTKEINPQTLSPEAARAEIEFLLKAGMKMQSEIYDEKRPDIIEVDGHKYLSSGSEFNLIDPVRPDRMIKAETFDTFSLDGLINYIKSDVDGIFGEESRTHIVRVSSPTKVEVISPVTGYWKERAIVARCLAVVPEIQFGRYMDPDDFQIMVQTGFEDTENRAIVLKLAGSLRKEQTMQTADDGVSQKVTVNAGVATAADVIVKNPVNLTPYRTFREVEQPESPFVLRFNEDAKAALFTGDGSAWKLEAVARIGEYLKTALYGYNVEIIA